MKNFLFLLLAFVTTITASAADVKLSSLPLGTATSTNSADSFPYVSTPALLTKRMTIWDIVNIPSLVSTYAPIASPTFTGVATSPSFVGPLTGNATTATALAANPTDCAANTYAYQIAANGNLTCSAVNISSDITGVVQVAHGGTGLSSTTVNQILYSSSASVIAGLATANTGALVTSSGGVPSIATGAANTVLRSNGTTVSFTTVNVSSDVTGVLQIANGGTSGATKSAAFQALSPMTTSGDLTIADASAVPVRLAKGANGALLTVASGLPAYTTATYPATTTVSQILYSSSANVVGGITTANTGALVTNSSGVPAFTSGAVANKVLRTDGTTISFAAVAASTDLTGAVPIANGGTNATTANAGFNNLSPMTTVGDTIYGAASGVATRLAGGTTGQFLSANTGAAPTWAAPSITLLRPIIQKFAASATYGSSYYFTVTSANATVGATYTNNGATFTVYATIASGTSLAVTSTGAPAASGTLTKSGGTGDSTITFSTYTAPVRVMVQLVGGGGGGGGSAAAASQGGAGGGGGSGAPGFCTLTSAQVGATQTVTIGAAGTAGTAGNNAGGNGGTTSFGSLCTGGGGSGGGGSAGSATTAVGASGAGGTVGTTDFGGPGGTGGYGFNTGITWAASGSGANSIIGNGGYTGICAGAGQITGGAAGGKGAGGGGGTTCNAATVGGGVGTIGYLVATDFYQ